MDEQIINDIFEDPEKSKEAWAFLLLYMIFKFGGEINGENTPKWLPES